VVRDNTDLKRGDNRGPGDERAELRDEGQDPHTRAADNTANRSFRPMIHGMPARLAIAILALVTGGFMVVDGIHVLVTGTFFGPPEPGPWSQVARAVGLDPFALGVPFVVLGAAWLIASTVLLLTASSAAWWALLVVAAAALWYLPVGTLTALATIAVLVLARGRLTA
jgi:hypothetical protein